MSKFKVSLKFSEIEVGEGETLEDVVVAYIIGMTNKYDDYLEFEEIK